MLNSSKKIHRNLSKNNFINLYYFDYDEYIKNKKKIKTLKELSKQCTLYKKNVIMCNDYLCDNLIYFVAKCKNTYYQINNFLKTRSIITDICEYIELCENQIYIFDIDVNSLEKYKSSYNDIDILNVDVFDYEILINYNENSFICVGKLNKLIVNATIYLGTKLYFFIDNDLVIFKNIISCLKNVNVYDKNTIYEKMNDNFKYNLNVWTMLSYNINNLFKNVNQCVYSIITKNEYCKNDLLSVYLNKTLLKNDNIENNKINFVKFFMGDLSSTFENDYVLSNVVYYLNCKKINYIWNIIIPYYNRKDNLLFLLQNLNEMVGTKIEIIISVVEISYENNYYELELDKFSNVNYFWINKKLTGGIFVKCLCANMCHIISSQFYSYDYILWHDVDCIVQSGFYGEIERVIKCITKNDTVEFDHAIIPYPNKTVLRTNEELAKKIRCREININVVCQTTEGIDDVIQGSPGGSLLIKTSLFEKMGMFNTSIFYGGCPEDNFILILINKYGYMYNVKQNSNQMIHLWH